VIVCNGTQKQTEGRSANAHIRTHDLWFNLLI
jgi:hypothetical protein